MVFPYSISDKTAKSVTQIKRGVEGGYFKIEAEVGDFGINFRVDESLGEPDSSKPRVSGTPPSGFSSSIISAEFKNCV